MPRNTEDIVFDINTEPDNLRETIVSLEIPFG